MTPTTGRSDLPSVHVAAPRRVGFRAGAFSGILSAALALAVGQALASLFDPLSSPVIAVGGAAIDATPEFLKSFAIRTFGTNDKPVLIAGIFVVLAIAAATIGLLATRRISLGWAGIGLFGLVGLAAVLTRPGATTPDAMPVVVGVLVGGVALTRLVRSAEPGSVPADQTAGGPQFNAGRRRFIVTSGVVGGLTVLAGGLGIAGISRRTPSTAGFTVPTPGDIGPATPAGAGVVIDGVPSFITANSEFYRVDTALIPPALDPASWRLRIHGMVDHELNLDLGQLLARPLIERDITLTCVSNEVGGPYAGNARWIGIPLKALLEEAGVQAGADQIVSRSSDGFTAGTPTAIVMDGRDALLAVAMNGQPLPVEHGYPVRMIVPGLYGYVSATKWLVDLELTTFSAFDAYWVQRGWKQQAPIKTMARIDAPKPLANLPAGKVAIGGVAWAQHRGIDRVEVQVDDGPWTNADLAPVDTLDTWRQWSYAWTATSGRHAITVRATDGTGTTQTEARSDAFPDGATGWHSLVVTVS